MTGHILFVIVLWGLWLDISHSLLFLRPVTGYISFVIVLWGLWLDISHSLLFCEAYDWTYLIRYCFMRPVTGHISFVIVLWGLWLDISHSLLFSEACDWTYLIRYCFVRPVTGHISFVIVLWGLWLDISHSVCHLKLHYVTLEVGRIARHVSENWMTNTCKMFCRYLKVCVKARRIVGQEVCFCFVLAGQLGEAFSLLCQP